jgi:hypothetical protein
MDSVARILELARAPSPSALRSKVANNKEIIDFSSVLRSSTRGAPGAASGTPGCAISLTEGPLEKPSKGGAGAREALREGNLAPDDGRESGSRNDPGELPVAVDPLALALALPVAAPPPSALEPAPRAEFASAVEELVRRIAWGGDRSSGTARIEFGAGRYRGGIILVHAEGRDVTIELELPNGADAAELGERLRARLEEKGINLTGLRSR